MKIKLCKICNTQPKILPYSYCKECQAEFNKKWRNENKELIKIKKKEKYIRTSTPEKRWAGHLNQRYGLTPEQYLEMVNIQNGVCKICLEPSIRLRLSVDHCHTTGNIRGLLCERCNTLLGRVKDNPTILINAAQYLIDSKQ